MNERIGSCRRETRNKEGVESLYKHTRRSVIGHHNRICIGDGASLDGIGNASYK